MIISGEEYKIRLQLCLPDSRFMLGSLILEDRLFDTIYECYDCLKQHQDDEIYCSAMPCYSLVHVEYRPQSESFYSTCRILEEYPMDWYFEWFDMTDESDEGFDAEFIESEIESELEAILNDIGKSKSDIPECGRIRIQGIDFVIGVEIFDKNDISIDYSVFDTFPELNDFINEKYEAEPYAFGYMQLGFCENRNGCTEPFDTFTQFDFKPLTLRQIFGTVATQTAEINKSILRHTKPEDYKQEGLTDNNPGWPENEESCRVCCNCYKPIDECTCESREGSLDLDIKYIPIIKELNKKGYYTHCCCAGHIKDDPLEFNEPYISFKFYEQFEVPLPERYIYFQRDCSIRLAEDSEKYVNEGKAALIKYHDEITEELFEWAKQLPNIKE